MNKQPIKNLLNLIKVLGFMAVLIFIYSTLTYVMRNDAENARLIILDFYGEEKNSLDMVMIGGSNVYRYWSPMKAYGKYGFTSYCYAASAMDPSVVLPSIKDVMERQKPKLILIEARPFLEGKMDRQLNSDLRNTTDSWDIDLDRIKAVKYICDANKFVYEDRKLLYFDFIQYHDNYEALTDLNHWKLFNNRSHLSKYQNGFYKGFAIASKYKEIEDPRTKISTDCNELNEIQEKLLIDVLEYSKELGPDTELIFVASPYGFKKKEFKQLNEIAGIVDSYGVEFVNSNLYLDDMEMDYSTDFYNNKHVNILGAEKYTSFLADYLVQRNTLPDHRGEYTDWDEVYKQYEAEEKEAIAVTKEKIKNGEEEDSQDE